MLAIRRGAGVLVRRLAHSSAGERRVVGSVAVRGLANRNQGGGASGWIGPGSVEESEGLALTIVRVAEAELVYTPTRRGEGLRDRAEDSPCSGGSACS